MPRWTDYSIRPLERNDLRIVLEWRNSDRIREAMFTDHIISAEEHLAWFEQVQKNNSQVALIFQCLDEALGFVSFTTINNEVGSAAWGFYIGNASAPKGLGEIMGYLGLEYAFQQLDFKKVYGEAFDSNIASIKFHIKLGFSEEISTTKKVLKNGDYYDVIQFGLVKEKWLNLSQGIKARIFKSLSNDNIGGSAVNQCIIGPCKRPFIIAEMSGNHNNSLERALEIVDAAASAGVHALKIQTYTAETMTLDIAAGEFQITDDNSLWAGQSLYSLYQTAYTPWEWHKPIFDRCKEVGLIGFSTPFDASAVDFLETLNVPCYKIASFENIDLPLIRKVASTGKPLIISTGMATVAEIDEAVRTARQAGCKDIVLLKCTSNYPANPENTNLRTIPHMHELFNCEVGLSDHTMGIGVAVASVAFGAIVIEKHFTLSRADGGVDSAFSLEPHEMKILVEETQRAWQALGKISYGAFGDEQKSLQFRRSLYVGQDMQKGDTFNSKNLRIIRPGLGLPPNYYEIFLGKKVNRDVTKGTPISWEMI